MKRKYTITIPGEPVKVYKSDDGGRATLTTYQEAKIRYFVSIQNQFENEKIINEPFEATIKFFLPKNCAYDEKRVSLVELFKFLNKMLRGVVYNLPTSIYLVNMKKIYSDNPRTEIILKPLEDNYDKKD